jgi:hypothetical protein
MVMGLRYTPLHPMAAEDDHAFIINDAEIDALIAQINRLHRRHSGHRARQDRSQGAARAMLARPQPRRCLNLSEIFRTARGNN